MADKKYPMHQGDEQEDNNFGDSYEPDDALTTTIGTVGLAVLALDCRPSSTLTRMARKRDRMERRSVQLVKAGTSTCPSTGKATGPITHPGGDCFL